jgi:hypothetical protein
MHSPGSRRAHSLGRAQPRIPEKEDSRRDEKPAADGLIWWQPGFKIHDHGSTLLLFSGRALARPCATRQAGERHRQRERECRHACVYLSCE